MQKEKSSNHVTTTRRKSNGTGKSTATKAVSTVASTHTATIVVSGDERRKMIQEAAYLRAERRGFKGGDPRQDWLEAEVEVDARIASWRRQGARSRVSD
jgi:energy-coupling factor transporter ATP-binding protein EcfA2